MKNCVVTTKSSPSSSSWLSQNSVWNVSYLLTVRKHNLAHILGMIAFFLQTHHVACSPRTEKPYKNGAPNYRIITEDSFSNEDQIKRFGSNEEWNDLILENDPSRTDYFDIRNSNEINFRDGQEQLEPISTEPSNNMTPPIPTGCHEPGCPLPLMSDAAFSLVVMIYVIISFLFVFFAFCWNNHYPRSDSKGAQRTKGKLSCPLITTETKLDSNTTADVNKKQIGNIYDYQNTEMIER